VAGLISITLILWHSTQSWRFLIAPLALYAVDRMIRLYNSSLVCNCEQLTANVSNSNDEEPIAAGCEATKLTFTIADYSAKRGTAAFRNMPFKMGQYVFVNISNISLYEWHPFTISSGEDANQVSIHVKNMDLANSRCWSNLLYELALSKTPLEDIEFHIDGPYGKPFEYEDYDRVVLVAGGIGITPCHSIFATMLERAVQGLNVPFVDLIWVSRHATQVGMFLDTWQKYEQHLGLNRFNIRLFVTRSGMQESSFQSIIPNTNLMYTQGRPPWENVLGTLLRSDDVASDKSLVFACGPSSLVNEVEIVSVAAGAHFYSESFEF
jgi:NAD(P)H-flavin reductase